MLKPPPAVPDVPGASIEKVAPPGSSTRAVLQVARQVVHDGVRYGDHLRDVWGMARRPARATPTTGPGATTTSRRWTS